jgi:hypothetical protein
MESSPHHILVDHVGQARVFLVVYSVDQRVAKRPHEHVAEVQPVKPGREHELHLPDRVTRAGGFACSRTRLRPGTRVPKMRSVRRSAWRRAVLLQSQVSPCNRGAISAGDGCRFRYWSEQRTGIEFWGSQFSERHYTARQPAPDPGALGPRTPLLLRTSGRVRAAVVATRARADPY